MRVVRLVVAEVDDQLAGDGVGGGLVVEGAIGGLGRGRGVDTACFVVAPPKPEDGDNGQDEHQNDAQRAGSSSRRASALL